jgi:hypothetical protein
LLVTRATQALSENTNTWQSPQAGCQLGDGEVHVWRTRRHWSPAAIARFRDLLSSEERAKADAFHFEADRHRAIVGRGLLRHLLGKCLNRPPDALQIFAGLNGKPELVPALDATPVAFNISHSGDWVLVALAQQRAVGVDRIPRSSARGASTVSRKSGNTVRPRSFKSRSGESRLRQAPANVRQKRSRPSP